MKFAILATILLNFGPSVPFRYGDDGSLYGAWSSARFQREQYFNPMRWSNDPH